MRSSRRRSPWLPVLYAALAVAALSGAQAQLLPAAPMDLLTALQNGQAWAQFRGNGPSSVSGAIGRLGQGPLQLSIPSGTQLFAQRPGVQGMTTLGSVPVDLSTQPLVLVQIPTACTNLGWRTPTGADVMIPAACPDAGLARLATLWDGDGSPQPARQLAVWAVANNPPAPMLATFMEETYPAAEPTSVEKRVAAMNTAANLLRAAGMEPTQFRMFW